MLLSRFSTTKQLTYPFTPHVFRRELYGFRLAKCTLPHLSRLTASAPKRLENPSRLRACFDQLFPALNKSSGTRCRGSRSVVPDGRRHLPSDIRSLSASLAALSLPESFWLKFSSASFTGSQFSFPLRNTSHASRSCHAPYKCVTRGYVAITQPEKATRPKCAGRPRFAPWFLTFLNKHCETATVALSRDASLNISFSFNGAA